MRTTVITGFAVVVLAALALAADAPKTYKPDGEGFIRNWVLLDPIALDDNATTHEEGSEKAFFDKDHFPGQKEAKPKDGDKVSVAGKDLAWHARQADEFSVDLEKFANDVGKEPAKALFLGVAYLTCEEDVADVKLAIGSDDSSAWRLNRKELIRVFAGRAVEKDQDTSPAVTLKKGVNVLTFAVINGDGPTGACARFQDKDGKPVTKFTVSVTP
jgi:hypothetical protein